MLKTGEMLNMLNFLGPKAPFRPTDLTYLTVLGTFPKKHLTFPLFRGHETGEMLNVFLQKCLKQGKC